MCAENKNSSSEAHVPDFSTVGFTASGAGAAGGDRMVQAHAAVPDLKALKLSVCVGGSYNPSTNQICFTIPIYGDLCVTSPVPIPIGGSIKVCAETCGSFIPTGLKATIYLNGNVLFSTTVFGFC